MTDDITLRWLASVEQRGKRPEITRMRHGATKLGISLEEYARHVLAGYKWCSGHKGWCRASDFGPHTRTATGIDTQCRESSRAYAREYQRRKRQTA